MEGLFEILHEDPDLLVINKPAGLVCHPTKTDEYSSLISRVRLYLGSTSHPQLVNRLDRETSGVTLIAKTPATARELRGIWEKREVQKEYLAIVHGHVVPSHGTIDAALGKDERSIVAIKDCVRTDGAPSTTEFWVEKTFSRSTDSPQVLPAKAQNVHGHATPARPESIPVTFSDSQPRPFSLLRVLPYTGRKHQIRIHLAHIGHPVVGDKLYGGDEDLYMALVEDRLTVEQRRRLILPHQALHAACVKFNWRGAAVAFHAPPEPWFTAFLTETKNPGRPA